MGSLRELGLLHKNERARRCVKEEGMRESEIIPHLDVFNLRRSARYFIFDKVGYRVILSLHPHVIPVLGAFRTTPA